MKLPWDKDYLKIAFHVIFTLILGYVLIIIMQNFGSIFGEIITVIKSIFSVLAPVWIGLIIAYLLDPLTDYFQNKYELFIQKNQKRIQSIKRKIGIKNTRKKTMLYKSRAAGASISYITVVIVLIVLGKFISSSFGGGSSSLSVDVIADSINDFTNNITNLVGKMQTMMGQLGISEEFEKLIKDVLANISNFTKSLAPQLVTGISKTGGYVINLVLGIVVAFYFLKDKHMLLYKTKEMTDVIIPQKVNLRIKTILSDIDAVFSGYIRGQLTDALIMAILISIALSLIGIDYAIIIGIIAGFTNVIPYVGAMVGLALAVIVGLLSGTPIKAVYALIVMLVLQQVDGAVIVPRVVGNQVDLHPILVLMALAVGGAVFGIVGMIFAVPVTAILKIFLIRYLERRKKIKEIQ